MWNPKCVVSHILWPYGLSQGSKFNTLWSLDYLFTKSLPSKPMGTSLLEVFVFMVPCIATE
jgi:hypothetical protein